MTAEQLFGEIIRKKSFLCVGLDPEMAKLPRHLLHEEFPVFEFNRRIIDATHDLVVAFKPNVAFYECLGTAGWRQLELTVDHIRRNYPGIMVIADAKRADIGNTSRKYAETFYEHLNCDAVTVAPYMGSDSVLPFLDYAGKWVILLALTSNKGAEDFQMLASRKNEHVFESVLKKSLNWGNSNNMMYVIGATKAANLVKVREIVPDHFLLIPGVGAQGGDLAEVAGYGLNSRCGLIVNSSRAIIYADSSDRFAAAAREKAREVQQQMGEVLGLRFGV